MPTIIHHYTNIAALAMILKNRSLRFTRLDAVDDPEESNFISNGVNLGPYTFVSCWTEAKEESIPMWKMYTNAEWGVRLTFIKEGLFKTYTMEERFQHNGLVGTTFGAPIRMLFPLDILFNQRKFTPPILTENYDACKFYRRIRYVDNVNSFANDSVQIGRHPDGKSSVCIMTDKVGSYKHKRWAFQEEARFVLFFFPGNSLPSTNTSKFDEEQNRMINYIMCNKDLGFSHYDMYLSDDAFNHLTITMSPLSEGAQWSIVEALRDKYARDAQIVESNLAGKLK